MYPNLFKLFTVQLKLIVLGHHSNTPTNVVFINFKNYVASSHPLQKPLILLEQAKPLRIVETCLEETEFSVYLYYIII